VGEEELFRVEEPSLATRVHTKSLSEIKRNKNKYFRCIIIFSELKENSNFAIFCIVSTANVFEKKKLKLAQKQ